VHSFRDRTIILHLAPVCGISTATPYRMNDVDLR
jgi:hypothetical protein